MLVTRYLVVGLDYLLSLIRLQKLMIIICEFTDLGSALNDVIYGIWIQILLVHSNQLLVHFVHVFSDFTRETPP